MDSIVFQIEEEDVDAALNNLDIEQLSTGRMLDLYQFVGDRFENISAQDLQDAICDFFDLEEAHENHS